MKKIVITLVMMAAFIFLAAGDQNQADNQQRQCEEHEMMGRNLHFGHGEGMNDELHCRKMGKMEMGFLKEIDLTEDQKQKLETLKSDHQKKMISFDAQIATLEIDKDNALRNEKFQDAKNLITQIGKIKTDAEIERLNMHEKVMNMLTAEQKAKLREMKECGRGKDGCECDKMEKGQKSPKWR